MIKNKINWSVLQEAIDYYKVFGYEHIEVPWIVPKAFKEVTFVEKCYDSVGDNMYLVGSAEQSFIYMDFLGNLPKGKYVACSPCFRKYDDVDATHSPYFMKVELYDNQHYSIHDLKSMVKRAKNFFDSKFLNKSVKVVDTHIGYDIELDGIELGSYGVSNYKGKSWLYGTAIAEPRFSLACGVEKTNILGSRVKNLNV